MLGMIFRDGLTKGQLNRETYRNKFSDYLPYLAYDEETRRYLNTDDTIGYVWECSPLCYAGERTFTSLEGILRFAFPEGTVLQFILYADNYIDPFLNYYRSLKTRQDPLIKETTDRFCKFLKDGTEGISALSGIPVRNYRLFVTVKIPISGKKIDDWGLKDIYETVEDRLRGAGLMPEPIPPGRLLAFLRRLFNGSGMNNSGVYDDTIPMNKQIILSENGVSKSFRHLKIGETLFKCITPKTFPKEIDPLHINSLTGGIYGVISDSEQIKTPFLYTVNVIFQDLKGMLHTKCNFILQQHAVGSFAPSLKRKQEEYLWATDSLEKGINFLRIIPAIWVFHKDEKVVSESVARVKRIWEGYGFIMQEDAGILPILFVSSLPFGLYNTGSNITNLDRDFIAHTTAIARVLPVQADFTGNGATMVFIGRKGQLTGIDLFSKGATNYNAVVSATSGSGKSFLVNYIVYNHFANNAIIRLVDIGGSYKKLVRMFGAKYIDFNEKMDLCLNPFSFVKEPEYDLPVITPVVAQMVYTAEKKEPSQTEYTILQNAIQWAYQQEGNDASIDTVYTYLNTFPKHAANFDFDCPDKQDCATEIKTLAHTLAFNIYDFTSDGMYGKYFNGKATFDISQDELVVLELERLKTMPDLFNVVTLQVINAIAADLYLSDRNRPRITIFDEAWQFLKETSHLKVVIEEGYRKARKYFGSFIVVFQSDLDTKAAGSVGEVIMGNSAYKFKLESADYEKAKAEKIIDYDDFTMKILKSVRTNKPYYSEVFIDSNQFLGVARLCVDPFSYYVYTSSPDEVSQIEALLAGGMSYKEAVDEMVKKRSR